MRSTLLLVPTETKQSQKELEDGAKKGENAPCRTIIAGCGKGCTEKVANLGIVDQTTIVSPVVVADFDKATVKV